MNTRYAELIYSEHGLNLLKVICSGRKAVYHVTCCCRTKVFEDYDDALEYYNLKWIEIKHVKSD